jgi:predicted transposase/invertase (TIGR01784 family)
MPMNPEKFKQIITDHFKTVTPEEFLANLRKSSPYLFTEMQEEEDPCISEIKESKSAEIENTRIYQQAKQESKLEIAPKLLKKGLSIQEVAEILDLDVQLLVK